MSSQQDPGVSFEISNQQQNFRLLELPPALLALMVSKDPPNLYLKAAESPNAQVDSEELGSSAVLCTDNHTFQLRQVQSSNSVFILQPSESYGGDDEVPTPSLSAIAQCTNTLELVPLDSAASSAMLNRLLKRKLPPYKGPDAEHVLEQDAAFAGEYKDKDKDTLLQDAPFSIKEFNETWKQLCAFQDLGRAWLPTSSALAMVWKSILSAATVMGVNLENTFDLKPLADIVGSDGYPWAFIVAVATNLTSDTYLKDDCLQLSREKTIQWVGNLCLERAGGSENSKGIPESKFLAHWHDLLPEGWRKHASMDVLEGKYLQSDLSRERIVFSDNNQAPTSLRDPPSTKAGGKANRKWHEKFKAGRK